VVRTTFATPDGAIAWIAKRAAEPYPPGLVSCSQFIGRPDVQADGPSSGRCRNRSSVAFKATGYPLPSPYNRLVRARPASR
jgi:hypothetical protein